MRKIIGIIISVLMSVFLCTGCALFEYDFERDYKQVAVTIDSVTIDGGAGTTPYTAPEKKIYKYDIATYFNQVGATLVNENGYTIEDAVDYCVDQLVARELLLSEAEAQLHFGNMIFSQYEENLVLQSVYSFVDGKLASLRNDILTEHGYQTADQSSVAETTPSAETTYPVYEEKEEGLYDSWSREMLLEKVNELTKGTLEGDALNALYEKNASYSDEKLVTIITRYDLANEPVWAPDTLRYPGLYGNDEIKSLELEAMRRFMAYLKTTVDEDYRISDKAKKEYYADINALNAIGDEKGLPYIYPALGTSKVMAYFVGDEYRESIKIQLLQEYVTNSVDVTKAEVEAQYELLLGEQRQKYSSSASFEADMSAGNNHHLVYYPNGSYFYVKHILVPFSDAQATELSNYKAQQGTVAGADAIKAKKEALGNAVTGFEHRDGENYGKPVTIQQIYADITTEMAKVVGNATEQAKTFDKLIYKYNTDEGIFNNELGYAVKVTTGDNYDTKYMEEFSRAAKELYEAGVEGAVSEPVTTDYGVHILFLSKVIPSGGLTVGLDDYISYSSTETLYEHLRAEKLANKINQVFAVWQNEKIGNYQTIKKIITRHESVYADLKESK